MILITGATGQLGKATTHFLINKIPAGEVAVMVRDEAKAENLKAKGVEVRTGDYTNYESMVKAFTGVDKLFLISSNDMAGQRANHHINAINAAKAAGVKHIIYTSFDTRDAANTAVAAVTDDHVKTVAHLKETGIPYTLLNNNLYADVLPGFLGEQVLEQGIFFPAGNGKVPFATREDMAEAAANILASEGHEGKEYVLASDTNYTFHDVAEGLSEIAGKKVNYHSPTPEEYAVALTGAGVPEGYVGFFNAFGKAISDDEFNTGKSDLRQLLGRKPTSLQDYLKSTYAGAKTN